MRRLITAATALVTALVFVLSSVVLADNVQNDVVVATNAVTVAPGSSATVNFRLHATNNDSHNGCNASPTAPTSVTFASLPGVTISPNPISFTACGVSQAVTFAPSTSGSRQVTATASGGVGSYNTNPASFTLNATASDTTPPVIVPTVTGTLGQGGWYTSDVTVSWNVSDGQSTITSQTGCGTTTITADQAATTYTCTAESGGGSASVSVVVKRDATAPAVTPGDVNNSVWRNSSLSESFTSTDATAGLVNATDASFTLTASAESASATAPTTVSRTVLDQAGNSTPRTVSALIDLTAPTVTCPTPAPEYPLNQPTPADLTAAVADGLSGATASTAGAAVNVSSVGAKTASVTGYDNAGNSSTVSCAYAVRYARDASTVIGHPINPDGSSVFNQKRTVPVKFGLAGDEPAGFGTTAWKIQRQQVSGANCTNPSTSANEDVPSTSASSVFRYDATDDHYVFNAGLAGTTVGACYRFVVTLDDGSAPIVSPVFRVGK